MINSIEYSVICLVFKVQIVAHCFPKITEKLIYPRLYIFKLMLSESYGCMFLQYICHLIKNFTKMIKNMLQLKSILQMLVKLRKKNTIAEIKLIYLKSN